MHIRPQSRTDQLVSQTVRDELVVYDERDQIAHALSPAVAAVWRECTGSQTVEVIAARLGVEPAFLEHALADLEDRGLLEPATATAAPTTPTLAVEPAAGLSRRMAAKRIAAVSGAVAAPLIYSLAIGPAIAAASACTATGAALPKSATCSAALIDEFGTVTPKTACCGGGCANNGGTLVCANSTSGLCLAKGVVSAQAALCCGGGTCTTTVLGSCTLYTCN